MQGWLHVVLDKRLVGRDLIRFRAGWLGKADKHRRQQCDLLPGAVQFRGNGHTVTIVNPSHHLDPDLTEVWFDGVEITNWVVELKVEIDPDQDLISAYLIYNSLGLTVTQEFVG